MARSISVWIACLALLCSAATIPAADEITYSGPQVGEALPPLQAIRAYGDRQGESFDPVTAAEGGPLLLVFIHGANRPAARVTRALMNYAQMRAEDGLAAATIWLDDDRAAAMQYLGKSISWWGVERPFGISADGAEGPGSYGLNRNVNVTVLVAEANLVTANFALVQPSETDVPKILAEVVKLIGGDVPTQAVAMFLTAPTHRPDGAQWDAAPKDVTFRRRICDLLAADAPSSAADAAKRLQQYVSGNPNREDQLRSVAEMLSKGRMRIDAIPAARYIRRLRTQQLPQNRQNGPTTAASPRDDANPVSSAIFPP